MKTLRGYRIWVNAERTILITLWATGAMEIATRETSAHTWGPPVTLEAQE